MTSFGLMLQAMENGIESIFFQLYSISRFHTVGTDFVFEAVNQDTGFLDIHVLEGSLITAKSVEAGITVAIQLKLNGMQSMQSLQNKFDQAEAHSFNETQPMSTQNYNRKTSFFSEASPATKPGKERERKKERERVTESRLLLSCAILSQAADSLTVHILR